MRFKDPVTVSDRVVSDLDKVTEVTLSIGGLEFVIDDEKLIEEVESFGDREFFITLKLTGSGTIDFRFVPGPNTDAEEDEDYRRAVAAENLKFKNDHRGINLNPTEEDLDTEVERMQEQAKSDEVKAEREKAASDRALALHERLSNTVKVTKERLAEDRANTPARVLGKVNTDSKVAKTAVKVTAKK